MRNRLLFLVLPALFLGIALPVGTAEAGKPQFSCRALLGVTLVSALAITGVQKVREPYVMVSKSKAAHLLAEMPIAEFGVLPSHDWELLALGFLWPKSSISSFNMDGSNSINFRYSEANMLDWYFFLADADEKSNGKINEYLKAEGLPYRFTKSPTSADTLPFLSHYKYRWAGTLDKWEAAAPYLRTYPAQREFARLIGLALKDSLQEERTSDNFAEETFARKFERKYSLAAYNRKQAFPTAISNAGTTNSERKVTLANSEVADAPHLPEADLATLNSLRVAKGLRPLAYNANWSEHLRAFARDHVALGFDGVEGEKQGGYRISYEPRLGAAPIVWSSHGDERTTVHELWNNPALNLLPKAFLGKTDVFRPEATSISYCYFRGVLFFILE